MATPSDSNDDTTENTKKTVDTIFEALSASVQSAGQKAQEVIGTVRESTVEMADKISDAAEDGAEKAKDILAYSKIEGVKKAVELQGAVKQQFSVVKEQLTSQKTAWTNAVLASDMSAMIDKLFAAVAASPPTIYDKAVDAIYNETHIGGGHLHRLLDGSHTPWAMWDKVRDASPDDTLLQEIGGYWDAMWKDITTTQGIPFMSMTRQSYDDYKGWVDGAIPFDIPADWIRDTLHVNATELAGTAISAISVIYCWNDADTKKFSGLAGSLGVSAIASANPLLFVVSLVVLARSIHLAKSEDDGWALAEIGKQGAGKVVFLATSALIPGPALIGVVTGVIVSAVASNAIDKIDAREVAEFVRKSIFAALDSTLDVKVAVK